MVDTLSESLGVRVTSTERREFEEAAAAQNLRASVALRLAMSLFVDRHRTDGVCSVHAQHRAPRP